MSRLAKYEALVDELAQSGEKQLSTTDVDARSLVLYRDIVEVCYSAQVAADAKNKPITQAICSAYATATADHIAHRYANQIHMGRKVFLTLCTVLFLLSCSDRESVSINKVEHFYISSSSALNVYQVLTEQFGLPVVWDYQNWGSFSSGGVSLGNVVIELIESQSAQHSTYYGIALEPNQSLKRTKSFLDAVDISHGRISKAAKWSTMSLTNLLPNDINLFLCDYHNRAFIALDRKNATDKLVKNEGGALGIEFLKEVIIGSKEPVEFENELAKIPGIVKKGNEFHFSEGPNLKMIKSDTPFFALLIKVKSMNKAKLELEALGFKTKSTQQGVEVIDEIFSTHITLME